MQNLQYGIRWRHDYKVIAFTLYIIIDSIEPLTGCVWIMQILKICLYAVVEPIRLQLRRKVCQALSYNVTCALLSEKH